MANVSGSQLILMVQADINGVLPRACCNGLSFRWGCLWPAKCQFGVFVQEGLGFCFCVFSSYSVALLNVFQCANTKDVATGLGGGNRKV